MFLGLYSKIFSYFLHSEKIIEELHFKVINGDEMAPAVAQGLYKSFQLER